MTMRGKWVPEPARPKYMVRVPDAKCPCGNSYDVGMAEHIHKHLNIRPGRNELVLHQVCSKCGQFLHWKMEVSEDAAGPAAHGTTPQEATT